MGRRGIAILVFLSAPLLRPGAASGAADNLNLANRFEQSLDATAATMSNPHAFPCKDCHEEIGEGRFIIYLIPDDSIAFCNGCHEGENLHPVNVDPVPDPTAAEQLGLPLGRGSWKGRIVCLTCHYVHNKEHRPNLLRGDDEAGKSRQEGLCGKCHGEGLRMRSPHFADEGRKYCHLCHSSPPKEGQAADKIVDPDVQDSCDFCHDTLGGGHYLALNPFADPDITWRFEKVGIPLLNGRFTCISCHDPHGVQGGRTRLLRPSYLKLAMNSTRIQPHWKDTMCMTCHEGEPAKGDPKLRSKGNINELCNRCHTSRYARRDLHPVGVVPSDKVTVPEDMPLTDGKLTCETCHDSSLQEGGEDEGGARKTNPRFLQTGGRRMSRVEFCMRCHHQDAYGKMNAHDQLDVWGSVKVKGCLFCHSSLPDPRLLGIKHVKFSTETLDDYCACCHGQEFVERHPVAPHLVEPSEKVREAIESAVERLGVEIPLYRDRLTCATCHNPHQEGVVSMGGGKGAQANRLRLPKGRQMCVACHTEK